MAPVDIDVMPPDGPPRAPGVLLLQVDALRILEGLLAEERALAEGRALGLLALRPVVPLRLLLAEQRTLPGGFPVRAAEDVLLGLDQLALRKD